MKWKKRGLKLTVPPSNSVTKRYIHALCAKARSGMNTQNGWLKEFPEIVRYSFCLQKADVERKSSNDSIASSAASQDSKKDRRFSKQRSFGFGRQSQAPSEVSVNLAPDRASNASLDDMGVSFIL